MEKVQYMNLQGETGEQHITADRILLSFIYRNLLVFVPIYCFAFVHLSDLKASAGNRRKDFRGPNHNPTRTIYIYNIRFSNFKSVATLVLRRALPTHRMLSTASLIKSLERANQYI